MTRTAYCEDKLSALVAQGMTLSEIAAEVGSTIDGVSAALRRRGMRATHSLRLTIRQKAEAMQPTAAVQYLLDQLDILTDGQASGTDDHPVDADVTSLTPAERRIVISLWDASGAVLTKEALLSAMMFGRIGDEPEIKIVDVLICKIRKKLPQHIKISTAWGRGYSLARGPAA